MTNHVGVWLDHKEARVFHLDPDDSSWSLIKASLHHLHARQDKQADGDNGLSKASKAFFHDIAVVLGDAQQILVVGPSTAKLEFLRYAHKHDKALEEKVVGVETVDHPTDAQFVAYAKKYFERAAHTSAPSAHAASAHAKSAHAKS